MNEIKTTNQNIDFQLKNWCWQTQINESATGT